MPVCSATMATGHACTKAAKHEYEGQQFCGIHRRFLRIIQGCSAQMAGGQPCAKRAKHEHEGVWLCGIHRRSALALAQRQARNAVQQVLLEANAERAALEHRGAQVRHNNLQRAGEQVAQARRQNNEAHNLAIARQHAYDQAHHRMLALRAELQRQEAIVHQAGLQLEEANARHVLNFNALQMAEDLHREAVDAVFVAELGPLPVPVQVVFARDPVGDVDMRAFAQDNQNVHRSAVQNSTEVSLRVIMERPLGEDQDTMIEIGEEFNSAKFKGRRRAFIELETDINVRNLEAFNHSYKDVLDHVWASIRLNEHKRELSKRLCEELLDGMGMCSNGKMCRLLTVLQGFDDQVVACVSRDAFQSKFSTLASLPLDRRELEAVSVFDEYGIPEGERQQWLEPLLEA